MRAKIALVVPMGILEEHPIRVVDDSNFFTTINDTSSNYSLDNEMMCLKTTGRERAKTKEKFYSKMRKSRKDRW